MQTTQHPYLAHITNDVNKTNSITGIEQPRRAKLMENGKEKKTSILIHGISDTLPPLKQTKVHDLSKRDPSIKPQPPLPIPIVLSPESNTCPAMLQPIRHHTKPS